MAELQQKFQKIFTEHAGKEVFDYISSVIAKEINKGQPDLFIYNDDECFFAEVKKKGDELSYEQIRFIEMMKRYKNRLPVKIIHLLEEHKT